MNDMIDRVDHFVLTVKSVETTCRFYEAVLGFERVDAAGRPTALRFGAQKINLHQTDRTFEPKAAKPTSGAGDFCLVTSWTIEDIQRHLTAQGVPVELGPVSRHGTLGPMTSFYIRDPDGNLVEISRYLHD